jgi:hypothetical protein
MPRMLVAAETMDGLFAVPFEPRVFRDLDLVMPRDRPLPAGARALMAHVKAGLASRGSGG